MRSQDVITEKQREIRKADLQHQEEKRDRERLEAQKNQNFTQVYPLGWKRLAELAKGNSAAFGFYTYLAQHIDGSCGAVVADQTFLAEQFNVTTRTIRNWVKYLEEMHALVKIPVTGRVCAYALNPHEVWKGYDNAKPYAAFLNKNISQTKMVRFNVESWLCFQERKAVKSSSVATLEACSDPILGEGGWFHEVRPTTC